MIDTPLYAVAHFPNIPRKSETGLRAHRPTGYRLACPLAVADRFDSRRNRGRPIADGHFVIRQSVSGGDELRPILHRRKILKRSRGASADEAVGRCKIAGSASEGNRVQVSAARRHKEDYASERWRSILYRSSRPVQNMRFCIGGRS